MKINRIIVLFILIATIAAINIYGTGHVIIFIYNIRFDCAFSSFITALIILFTCCYYSIRVFINIKSLPKTIKLWRQKRMLSYSNKYLQLILITYFAKQYHKTYKYASKYLNKFPKDDTNKSIILICYYLSNNYININNKFKNLDKWHQLNKNNEVILNQLRGYSEKSITIASLFAISKNYLINADYQSAVMQLNYLISLEKTNFAAHLLLLQAYYLQKNYVMAIDCLYYLIKHNAINENISHHYKIIISHDAINSADNITSLNNFYNKLNKMDKQNQSIYKLYQQQLNSYQRV